MSPTEELARLLCPAGGGIHTVSTGRSEQAALQRAIYGADGEREVDAAWRAALAGVAGAKVVVLGVPSDVGAGFCRGASFGPQAIRTALLDGATSRYASGEVIDLGDVRVVPHLLDDAMLSDAQLSATREAIYGSADDPRPVSPLSVAAAALRVVRRVAPRAAPLVLGGDHSVAWPALAAIAEGRADRLGILHIDAHTDLLETRLGVRYCFATWAYHANDVIGRGGKLVQVGVRISGRDRAHWESTLEVRQHWAADANAREPSELAAEIVDHLRARGVEGLYISNDIDGTDPRYASATGTPEPGGLHPDLVSTLISEVGGAFELWGSDLVEVAPPLAGEIDGEPLTTVRTAARYIEEQLALSV